MPAPDGLEDEAGDTAIRRRIFLAGVAIDVVTEDDVCAQVGAGLSRGRGGIIVTPNVDHLRRLSRGDPMASIYRRAALVVADGTPLIWASRLAGTPLPARVPGSDLVWSISATAAAVGAPVAIVGGMPGSAERAADRLTQRNPGLQIAGLACPPFGFDEDPEVLQALIREIAGWRPAVVFTGLSSPKGDLFNGLLADAIPAAWLLGVGAAIDMVAVRVRRAPTWAHRTGLEWLFRLAQEPGRLGRRYLIEDLPFACSLFARCVAQRVARRPRSITRREGQRGDGLG